MEELSSFLETRASFFLATMFVTWVVIFLLLIIVAQLHTRLQHLELAQTSTNGTRPYSHLLNQPIWSLLGTIGVEARPKIIFFLSANCKSCQRVLKELKSVSWQFATAIVWTDLAPENAAALPSHIITVPSGSRMSNELGIRVTPFMVVVDKNGSSVEASPVTNIERLKLITRDLSTEEVA